ncbi:MAG: FAD/NAD(P)-binding protein [Anaerolineae bacterium]
MLDWLIIGGGVQGTALSHVLVNRAGVAVARLRVLDPYDLPLARWHATTHNTGMTHLRSPEVHHLHDDPWSLRTFAQTQPGRALADFVPIYNRPSLALFNGHTDWMLERYKLRDMRLQGRALGLQRQREGWCVETTSGPLMARRVLLALNTTEQPHRPAWAQGTTVPHIFDAGFDRETLPPWSHLVIIGGGISAAQLAMSLAVRQPATVTLLTRHEIRLSHFDSDPCWVTRLCLETFHQQPDFNQRRAMIQQARQPGSMPPDVAAALRHANQTGALRLQRGEVSALSGDAGAYTLHLAEGDTLHADSIVLATGFARVRPGGAWLSAAIANEGLPVADCGYPVIDDSLRWADGLYVTGRLAELEIGPVAANIIGARLAAMRLKHAALQI